MQSQSEFDIRTPVGRERLAERHIISNREDKLASAEIVDGLASLVKHLQPRDWMVWRYGGFALPAGYKNQRWLAVPEAVELGSALQILSRCDNFAALLRGFENPTQFDDALFEVRMARWCVQRPTVKRLRFEPSYTVLGRRKRPDFELQTPIGRVVCECKRLHLHNQDWASRLTRIADAFDAAMRATGIPSEIRLEVVINRMVHGDLHAVATQACREVISAREGSEVEMGPFLLNCILGDAMAGQSGALWRLTRRWTRLPRRLRIRASVIPPMDLTLPGFLKTSPHRSPPYSRCPRR